MTKLPPNSFIRITEAPEENDYRVELVNLTPHAAIKILEKRSDT